MSCPDICRQASEDERKREENNPAYRGRSMFIWYTEEGKVQRIVRVRNRCFYLYLFSYFPASLANRYQEMLILAAKSGRHVTRYNDPPSVPLSAVFSCCTLAPWCPSYTYFPLTYHREKS